MKSKDNPTANMNMIKLKIEHPEHDMMVLTNERGDTFTSRSEELGDFLFGLEQFASTQPKRVSDADIEKKAYEIAINELKDAAHLDHSKMMLRLIEIAKWMRDQSIDREGKAKSGCDNCGEVNVPWSATNELWDKICGDDKKLNICPKCFAQKATTILKTNEGIGFDAKIFYK